MPWRGRYDRGVLATLLGVLLSGLLTAARSQPSVLEPLAVALMERTPLAMANWLVERLGFWARPLAMSGAVAIAMLAGGLLGLAVPRRSGGRREALLRVGLLTLGALGSCLWLVARGSSVAAVALLVVGWSGGWWLLGRFAWPPSTRAAAPDAPRLTRRAAVLHLANGGVVLASVAAFLALADSASLRLALSGGYPKRRFFPFEPPPARKAAFAALPEALPAEVTPVNRFYVMTKNVTDPAIAPDAWALRLEAAGRHVTLRYADLLALPRIDRYVTLRCVSNPLDGTLMSNGYFSGAPVRAVLAQVAPEAEAGWLRCSSPDRHRSVVPLDEVLASEGLVVYALNGQSLTREHGGPARLLVPGRYGFHNVKWLTRIELLDHPAEGYWEARGWTATSVHTLSRIDLVQALPDGRLLAGGVAFAGRRGISAVEVRMNDGPWQPAELHTPALAATSWVQWLADLPLPPGEARISARAVDGDGVPQREDEQPIFPDGAAGLHTVTWRG